MGEIKSTKLDNGMVQLEITYGGKEVPFGGIDTSAPPMYIAPNCFVNAENTGVFNEQIVALGWVSMGITLGSWPSGATFLGSGTACFSGFYYNWALAYLQVTNAAGPPPVIDIQYSLWVWQGGTTGLIPLTASLIDRQFGVTLNATPATAEITVSGSPATVAGSVSITVGGGATLPVTINIGDTAATVAANIAAAISGAAGYPCTAVVDANFNTQVDLTTTAVGLGANGTSIIISISQGGGGTVPCAAVYQGFGKAMNGFIGPFGVPISPLSWVQVGESLYFGGAGTAIFQFYFTESFFGPIGPVFQPITHYLGAKVLGKFNDQLIAIGIIPGPGQYIQASEMVIGWSAPNAFQIWNPTFSNGNVSGAGFNEITDIADSLTGFFICPGVALILRTQGLDYITSLGSGTDPFDFQHVSNALRGEGCQESQLVTQYDQVGFFVGNSDVYEFVGSLKPVGAKIKNLLIPMIQGSNSSPRGATSGVYNIMGELNTIVLFLVQNKVFLYCPANGTWMGLPLAQLGGGNLNLFKLTFLNTTSGFGLFSGATVTSVPVLTVVDSLASSPTFWQLTEAVQNVDLPHALPTSVIFPQEEVAFGRDIIIDGLLVSAAGTPGQVVNFNVSNLLSGTLILPGSAVPGLFVNYQVPFAQNVATVQNPQLSYSIPVQSTGIQSKIRFSKIALFGSFDPNQRPV